MNVLVIGATGFVGGAVARHLAAQGHTVTGLARTGEAAARLTAQGITPLSGDPPAHPAAFPARPATDPAAFPARLATGPAVRPAAGPTTETMTGSPPWSRPPGRPTR